MVRLPLAVARWWEPLSKLSWVAANHMLDVRSYQRDEQHGDYSRGRLLEMNAWQRRATAPGAPLASFLGDPESSRSGVVD
jgi:hypothetical protein